MESNCPYCRAPFETEEERVICPGCGTVHHAECLAENGGCTVFGCSQAPVEEAKISVTVQDVRGQHLQGQHLLGQDVGPYANFHPGPNAAYQPPAQPVAAPYSFLNLQTPYVPEPVVAPPVGVAPPPRLDGGAPPPPPGFAASAGLPSTTPPYSASPTSFPTFTGYAPAPYVPAAYPFAGYYPPRKNRVAFVLMAVFLGPFGGHNFYAGYTNKAIIQLCITVLSCFFGAIVSWIWAIVEACVVDCDSDGVAFV